MRVWHPVPPICLDTPRLRGCHLEIHTIYNVISQNLDGYSRHPEVRRWIGHLPALCAYHNAIVNELRNRGSFNHKTPLKAPGPIIWPDPIEPVSAMRWKLGKKVSVNRQG